MENTGISPEEIKELNQKMDRILSYLEDDFTTGRIGLYREVIDMKERVRNLEIIEKISNAKKAMLIMIGSVISGGIVWLYKIVFE